MLCPPNSPNRVMELAEIFRVILQGAEGGDSPLPIFPAGIAETYSYKIGRLSNSIDMILVRVNGIYKVYTVEKDNATGLPKTKLNDISSLPSQYVESVKRITGMNDTQRSGDIVFIMNDQTTGDASDRYTTGVACKAWHGSLNPSDSYVPLIVAYPGGTKSTIETLLTRDEVCKSDYSKCKGNWNLTDIVKGLVSEQYK